LSVSLRTSELRSRQDARGPKRAAQRNAPGTQLSLHSGPRRNQSEDAQWQAKATERALVFPWVRTLFPPNQMDTLKTILLLSALVLVTEIDLSPESSKENRP
jgi:hypothetical protein